MSNFRRMLAMGIKKNDTVPEGPGNGRLPAGYQEVEWIQPNQVNPFIDTKVMNSPNAGYEISFEPQSPNYGHNMYFGIYMYGSQNQNVPACIFRSNNQLGFYATFNDGNIQKFTKSTTAEQKWVVKSEKNQLFANDELIGTYSAYQTDWSKSISAHVFGVSGYGVGANIKLFYLKMYSGTKLIRDYVPCYVISGGEIGLFDLVEKKFYGNSGSDGFLKGPNVVSPTP